MRSGIIRAAVVLVLFACFACPVSEMFDHWDHTLHTGKDTESSFMILTVCLGAVISFSLGEVIAALRSDAPKKRAFPSSRIDSNFLLIAEAVTAVSQPPPALRI